MFRQQEYRILLSVLFHIFNILCQCSQLLCLTIDNRLAVVTNDCYSRISIGSKLSDLDVVSHFTVISLTECEEQCSKRGKSCNSFSFGVGVKGNGSCLIGNRTPVLENLQTHPDYDVYSKKQQDSPWCDFNHPYGFFTLRSGNRLTKIEKINNEGIMTSTVTSTVSTLIPHSLSVSLSIPSFNKQSFSRSKEETANYKLFGIYDQSINHHGRFLSGDDSHNRILDSLANRNERTTSSSPFGICHRKVQTGRKMIKVLTERVVNCENLQDCCRACAYEKSFVCKGFNHRQKIADSQCICELTSTPYSRMDADDDFLLDTDYDYYEREENCFPSVRNDNALHWKDHWKLDEQHEQERWSNEKYQTANQPPTLIDRRPSVYRENYPLLRPLSYEDPPGFVSRQNVLHWNDNRKHSITRYSDFINENTFPEYRIGYDKETYADVRSSNSIKPRVRDESVSFGQNGFPASNTNEYPHERYINYGTAFGHHDNNYVYVKKQSFHKQRNTLRTSWKCSIKAITGSKLSRNVLKKTCLAYSLDQCEQLCINETDFPCQSFAYRYNVLIINPTDNCLLSDLSYQNINFYTDLEPDRDYNSYVVIQDEKVCYSKESANRYPLEECFLRIRSGFAIPMDITKRLLFANNLGECQLACTTSEEFVCKTLVFKYLTEYRRHVNKPEPSNCFLTDWSSEEINPADMLDSDGAELYERSSLSYGCNHYPLPLLSAVSNIISPGNTRGTPSLSIRMDELCYFEHRRPCKLMPHAIVYATRTTTKPECRQKCSATRNTGRISCMSFNYINDANNTRDNCLLSDVSMQDLRPNLDYIYSDGADDNDRTILYTWNDLDPYCSVIMNDFHAMNITPASEIHDHPPWSVASNGSSGTRTQLYHTDIPIWSNHRDSVARDESKVESESYQRNFKLESINIDNKPLHESDYFEDDFLMFHITRELSTFQRYTVNGHPCKNATVCQRNEIAGFWSCEIEHGSWDYCCEPNHRCGFSQGYHYPWCYVGFDQNQWRPCSETYYPYYLPKNRSFYRQSPTHVARHWPIIYFHEMSPPNCSVDNSNNQNLHQNRRFNYRTDSPGNRPY